MKIREIMVTEIQVAEPDDTLDEIAVMMRDNDVGAIPVVEDGELIGIVTDRDIVVRCVAEGRDPAEIAADEIISADLQTIAPEAAIDEARRIMGSSQIRRLPVVEDGRLVGMVSLGDLAVKTGDEEEIADALEDISDGVKATGQEPALESESRAGARKQPKSAGANQRSKTSSSAGQTGKRQAGSSRIEEQSRGEVDRKQRGGNRVQGISSQGADREIKRQNRVVPIRTEKKSNARGQKGSSGRKAG